MRFWIKLFVILGIAAIVLEGAYLTGANYLLNSERIFGWINRKPEKFRVRWDRAWTPWPGMVRLRGVETLGQTKSNQWYASVDEVKASYRVMPLFRRTVDLTRVEAAGIDYRQRRRLDRLPQPADAVPGGPEIPGLPNPPDPPPELLYPKKKPKPPWTVIARTIEARRVRQAWIDQYRIFLADAEVDASMDLTVRGPLGFSGIGVRTEGARLLVQDNQVLSDMTIDVGLVIDPFRPRETKGREFFGFLSGEIDLDMHAAHMGLLNPYFQKIDWLKMNGEGRVTFDMALDHGVFAPGSIIRVDPDRIHLTLLNKILTGSGGLTGEVHLEEGTPVSRIALVLDQFQVTEEGASKPHMFGERFRFELTTDADLTNPPSEVRAVVDLPETELPDLTFYNTYLPPQLGLEILSGTGHVSYHFEGSQEQHSLNGRIDMRLDQVTTRFGETEIVTDLKFLTLLRNGVPREGKFDISGTRIELENGRVVQQKKGGKRKTLEEGWWGRFELPEAVMVFSKPVNVDARLAVSMKDSEPLVVLFDAKRGLPGFVERLMVIRDLTMGADIDLGSHQVSITDMDVTGEKLKFLGDLSFAEEGRNGLLFARFHGFVLGIELKGGKKDFKFLHPRDWFEKKREARRNAAGPTGP